VKCESDYYQKKIISDGQSLKKFKYLFFGFGSNVETVWDGRDIFMTLLKKIFN